MHFFEKMSQKHLNRVLTLPKARSRQLRQIPLKQIGLQNKNISVVTKHWTHKMLVPMSYIICWQQTGRMIKVKKLCSGTSVLNIRLVKKRETARIWWVAKKPGICDTGTEILYFQCLVTTDMFLFCSGNCRILRDLAFGSVKTRFKAILKKLDFSAQIVFFGPDLLCSWTFAPGGRLFGPGLLF